jgi:hypothetical protein
MIFCLVLFVLVLVLDLVLETFFRETENDLLLLRFGLRWCASGY